MKKIIVLFFIVIGCLAGYGQKALSFTASDYVRALKQATDIMVTDVASPVAAARYYAYITLSANETIALFDPQQPHFAGNLKGLTNLTINQDVLKKSDAQLAAILSLYQAAKRLLPSGYLLQKSLDSLVKLAQTKKLPVEKIETTIQLSEGVVAQVLRYAAADGFTKLSGKRRFTPATGDEFWQPTAPGFMSAIEPYWQTLRPFMLDSCSQFACPPPNKYSTDTASLFYKDMKEVYETGKHLSREQSDMANFWDCNPFALQQVGHLEFGLKKISPGGHWMGITGIACKKEKWNLFKTAYAHALVSLAIADAFIACWSDKYKYNRIRPVTAIKRLIDQNWNPLLQTPPFPEYASGHSVISNAAATVLTQMFGNHFSFVDDTEEEFGLPKRKFNSFNDAAKEAAISRLYGGIHFRDAVENGAMEGQKIGKFVIAHSPDNKNNQNALPANLTTK